MSLSVSLCLGLSAWGSVSLCLDVSASLPGCLFTVCFLAVVHGDYEELRFLFATSAFSDRSAEWLGGLVDALMKQLRSDYLSGLPKATLDMEGYDFTMNGSATTPAAGPAPKTLHPRSSPQELFYADINLLPQSLQDSDVKDIHDVSHSV